MASCMSGVAAGAGVATAALGLEAFEYNRENFLGDRDQRQEKEFKTQDYLVVQGKQWREDVEDLVSLTEKKMHIYNLTTILLVLITVFLWCEVEDTLSENTRRWLFCGFALANTGAFMFLLLSIWFSVYSAVVAQGYNARLRTQMVRVPIPSWQEIEACRTYGSQFERTEGRQLFRLPFVMGRQEALSKPSSAAGTTQTGAAGDSAKGASGDTGKSAEFADPWGLERRADDIQGLGCPLGAQVANLRHIKLTRQAATLWQSYDGFARVSLSIGINQLILGICYYFLAYLIVDVQCCISGTFAILVMIVLADCCLKLEMTLYNWQLYVAQSLGALGPIIGLVAAHQERIGTELGVFVAHWLIPFAFLAHGLYLLFMIYLCRVTVQPNGAHLPAAFKQRLYLDAFGWIKTSDEAETSGAERPMPHKPEGEGADVPPALDSIKYGAGGPVPTLPQDLAPSAHSDMRTEEGACDPSKRLQIDDNVEVPFYHWGHDGLHRDDKIVTGHEAEAPGVFPWRIFHGGLTLLALAWIGASAWRFTHAISEANVHTAAPVPRGKSSSLLQSDSSKDLHEASVGNVFKLWLSGYVGDSLASHTLELLQIEWPHPNVVPRTLSCDASGKHLVATDGLLAFSAEVPSRGSSAFEEIDCPSLAGESLQDATVSCEKDQSACLAQVLHRHGRHLTSCKLSATSETSSSSRGAGHATPSLISISEKWLNRDGVRHGEKVLSIAAKSTCHDGAEDCTYVHTSHGRIVQLIEGSKKQSLIPSDILHEDSQGQVGETATDFRGMRSLNSRYLGVLKSSRQSIQLYDMHRGGVSAGSFALPPTVQANAWCAGGGYLFLLSSTPEPKLWRLKLPEALS